jgi:hypothetical protein
VDWRLVNNLVTFIRYPIPYIRTTDFHPVALRDTLAIRKAESICKTFAR